MLVPLAPSDQGYAGIESVFDHQSGDDGSHVDSDMDTGEIGGDLVSDPLLGPLAGEDRTWGQLVDEGEQETSRNLSDGHHSNSASESGRHCERKCASP
jgi:hypothetical protein